MVMNSWMPSESKGFIWFKIQDVYRGNSLHNLIIRHSFISLWRDLYAGMSMPEYSKLSKNKDYNVTGELSRASMDVIENKRDIDDDVMDLYIVNVKRALNIIWKNLFCIHLVTIFLIYSTIVRLSQFDRTIEHLFLNAFWLVTCIKIFFIN